MMKLSSFINKIILLMLSSLAITIAHAGSPLWTFTALTATSLTVPVTGTASVKYTVTNQSSKAHTLAMRAIPGITQVTTAGNCPNPFILAGHQSCILNLTITGSALPGNISGGPVVCQVGSISQCYQPSPASSLQIIKGDAQYTVGGSVFGLQGTLVLQNNGAETITMTADGSFVFPESFQSGSHYAVTILSQPGTQTCTVTNGSGVITDASITNIVVTCSTNRRTIGGTVSGLSGTVVLQNNGTDDLAITSNGSFTFPTPLAQGSTYNVTVLSQPATQHCTVTNASGTVGASNVSNVQVSCTTNTFTIGGTVSGLTGTVVLQNNNGDNNSISSNGPFTFSTPLPQGSTYNVTVLSQPAAQHCTVTNASGTVGAGNVTNVLVTCAANTYTVGGTVSGLTGTVVLQNNNADDESISSNGPFTFSTPLAQGSPYNVTVLTQPAGQVCNVSNASGTIGSGNVTNVAVTCIDSTTLTTSLTDLALSVNNTAFNPALTGNPRIITITNAGSTTATGLTVTPPTWPSGTTSSTNCGSTLGSGSSCTITITPGNTATSNGTTPCTNGTAPVAGVVQVSAANATAVSTNVVVLGYGCVYQGGFLFAVNDATANTGSIGGQVAATTNEGSLSWSTVFSITGVNSNTNGASNTAALATPVGQFPAAQACINKTTQGFTDWYLPAICQMGYDGQSFGSGCGSSGSPLLQNIYSNLRVNGDIGGFGVGTFFSSSEDTSLNPNLYAWTQNYAVGSTQGQSIKTSNPQSIRRVRNF
nr:hypothetical protein [Legionella jordanis]